MGYIAIDVTMRCCNSSTLDRALDAWKGMFGDVAIESDVVEENGEYEVCFGVFREWESYRDDVENYSSMFPSVTIYGDGSGEGPGDIFRFVAKEGNLVGKSAIIIMPEFGAMEGILSASFQP